MHQSNNSLTLIVSGIRDKSEWLENLIVESSSTFRTVHLLLIGDDTLTNSARKLDQISRLNIKRIKSGVRFRRVRMFASLAQQLFLINPDIVHAHGQISAIYGLPISTIFRTPIRLYDRHHGLGNHVERNYRGIILDVFLNAISTHVIFHSRYIREKATKAELFLKKKALYVPLGISEIFNSNHQECLTSYKRRGRTLVGFNSRAIALKGIETVSQAIELLAQNSDSFDFLFLNVEPQQALYPRLSQIECDSEIHLMSEYDPLTHFYQSIDLFCHVPTSEISESFGFVYLESIFSKTPSIFTVSGLLNDVNELPEYVEVIPHNSPAALAAAIKRMAKSHSGSHRKLHEVPRVFLQYTISRYTQAQITLYSSLLNESSPDRD